MNQLAIGLSLIIGFCFSEFLGLACGGLISAGYLALFFQSPVRIIATVVCSLVVYFIIALLNKVAIIYGKRRFVLSVLLGFCLTYIWTKMIPLSGFHVDVRIIGYIIPGLIANDMVKQGILKTLVSLLIVTVLVKLILMTGISI